MRLRPLLTAGSLLLALLGARGLWAQVPIGDEFPLATSGVWWPEVAMAPAGDFVVTFVDSNRAMRSRRYDAVGQPQSAEFTVATHDVFFDRDIAATGSSGYVVVWTDFTERRIRARRLDASGAPVGFLFVPPSGTGDSDAGPAVAADANGGFIVVWANDAGSGLHDINGRRFDATGAPVGAEFRVSSDRSRKLGPSIATAADGTFVVGWGNYPVGSPTRAVVRRLDAAGAPLTPELAIEPTTPLSPTGMAWVASDPAGNFVAVWRDGPLKARKYRADGTPLSSFVTLGREPLVDGGAFVSGDASGNTLVTWSEMRSAPLGEDVWGRRLDAAAVPGPLFRVSSSRDQQYSIGGAQSMTADGRAVVVWSAGHPLGRRYGPIGPAALAADPAAGAASDGNRVLEPGEMAVLAPRWRNDGAPAQALQGQAAGFTGPAGASYSILDASARYPVISSGGAAGCLDTPDCYEVSVEAANRPAAHWDAVLRERVAGSQAEEKLWAVHIGDSFGDVTRPHPFYRFVETVLHRGVTAGCGDGRFCPDSPTTRAQTAIFLLLAREGPGYRTTGRCDAGWERYADVPASSPFCAWIEQLSWEGIVSGCGGGNFCPEAAVTREQMAVMVLRTVDRTLDPPACTVPLFADVPASSPFCRWIEELVRRGIASGCGGSNYCPQAPVTRGQMAVFLTQALGLQLYGP